MKNIIAIAFIVVIFYGCKGETGPAGPTLKGNLTGNVRLIDSAGVRMNENSGVVITVEEKSLSSTTNSQGIWTLNDLSTGTYTVTIAKSGFDSYKFYGYQFVGGGTAQLGQVYLHQLPSYKIQNISVGTSAFDKNIIVSGNITSSHNQTIILFLGKTVSVSNAPNNNIYYAFVYTGASNSFTSYINSSSLYPYGISSGDKIYIVAYPTTNGGWNAYTDPTTGKDVVTSISPTPSNIDSVIVP